MARNFGEKFSISYPWEYWLAGAAIAGLAKKLAAGPGSKGVNSKFASKRNQGSATLPRDRRENAPIKQAWARRHEQHCLAAIEMLDQ
jgi:hypothetical protein